MLKESPNMQKMIKKICLYTTEFAFNRQEMVNYLEEILPSKIEIFLFIPKTENNKFEVTRAKIVQTKHAKFLSFFELRKFCQKEGIDRIVNLGVLPQEGEIMWLASVLTKTDFITFQVGNPTCLFKLGLNKNSMKAFLLLPFLYLLTFPSKKAIFAAKDVLHKFSKPIPFFKKNIFHAPLPVDTDLFVPRDKAKSKKITCLNWQKTVIYVGRIELPKGSEILLEAAKLNPDVQFVLIGALNNKEVGIPNLKNVTIIPLKSQKELVDYYNSSDLCVFPSKIEDRTCTQRSYGLRGSGSGLRYYVLKIN